MKPFIQQLKICCLLLAVFIGSNMQAQIETESPYFAIFGTDSSNVLFTLEKTEVNATISGVIANVEIEQTYINDSDSALDAIYVFPMSSNSAIYGMEMELNNRLVKAEIRRKAEADSIFDQAEEDGLTATLLEQNRPNVFQLSLANIKAQDTIVVRMVYTELLVPKLGVYQFNLPNLVGPRFNLGENEWIENLQSEEDLAEKPFNVNLTIHAGKAFQAECISHQADFFYFNHSATTEIKTNPGSDVRVNYTLHENEISTGLLMYEGEDENFFLSIIQPPQPDVEYQVPEREYVFIMDVSGSMYGPPLEISKEVMRNTLDKLNPFDKFNVVRFAGSAGSIFPNSVDATQENIDLAMEKITESVGGGGTYILNGLQHAAEMTGTEGFARTFVILTDGFVTAEKDVFDFIRSNLNEVNFFAFGIGAYPNSYLINGIAYVGEGETFIAMENEEADSLARIFEQYIERPALTNIEVDIQGIDAYDIEPLTVPDVFADRPVIVYGKYNGEAKGSITVSGTFANTTVSETLNFEDFNANSTENSALPYLWARKKIRLMSDYGIASNENDTIPIEEEITLLGLKYSLITPYTSFVAVDSSSIAGDDGGVDDGGGDGTVGREMIADESLDPNQNQLFNVIGIVDQYQSELTVEFLNFYQIQSELLEIEIYDLSGKIVQMLTYPELLRKRIKLQLNSLPRGQYLIRIKTSKLDLGTQKFLVK